MTKCRYLIIGAGVTGLSFAYFLNNEDFLIVEKESEAGGYCKTIKDNDYIWDYSGHFYHFKTSRYRDLFFELMSGKQIIEKKKNTKIWYNNSLIDYPFQKNIHQLNKDEMIDCLYYLFKREEKQEYLSFKDMLYGKFGKGIAEKFLIPYNEKLYACDLDYLDVNAMGRFFPYAELNEIIENMKNHSNYSYNDKFIYPLEGAGTFIEALYERLNNKKVCLEEEIVSIDYKNRIAQTSKRKIAYDFLVNTSPLPELYKRLSLTNKTSASFTHNKVLVLNCGFDRKSHFNDIHWIYVPDKNINFYRVGFYDNILDSDKLSVYMEIGILDEDINISKELMNAIAGLKKIGIIDEHKLMSYRSVVMDPAYVHISKQSEENSKKIKSELAHNSIYTIGRYGGWKYCSIEDCIEEADNLSAFLKNL